MNKKTNKAQRKTGRPLKSILRPLHPKNHRLPFKNKIEENRHFFLQYLEERYSIPTIKTSLWCGTALHLLELSHKISPDMHQAANYYLALSKKVLQEGPSMPTSRFAPSHSKMPIPFSDRKQSPEKEYKIEKQWWDLSAILEEEGIKNVLDKLDKKAELPTLQYLIETEAALIQLQKGLTRLHNYLADARI
jgi:hypothetical protein